MLLRWVGASALVWALQLAVGCGSGQQSAGDGGTDQGNGVGGGQVGDVCQSATDCDAVGYPECEDLAETGTKRCESVCESNADCSDNTQCIGGLLQGGVGICLAPCQRDENCVEDWVCAFDPNGVGFCLWPALLEDTGGGGGDLDGGSGGGLSLNAPCGDPSECSEVFPVCGDWGDGINRCIGRCLGHGDCQGDALCVEIDASASEGACFAQCTDASSCPDGWTCETAPGGPSFCLP